MTQLPAPVKVTELPDTWHTDELVLRSTENTTGLPDPPPLADKPAEETVVPDCGAVKVIDWDSLVTMIVRSTVGAAAY